MQLLTKQDYNGLVKIFEFSYLIIHIIRSLWLHYFQSNKNQVSKTVLLEYIILLDSDFRIGVHQYIQLLCLVNGRKPLKDQGIRVAACGLRACIYYCQLLS